jgi:hypothetical protein
VLVAAELELDEELDEDEEEKEEVEVEVEEGGYMDCERGADVGALEGGEEVGGYWERN